MSTDYALTKHCDQFNPYRSCEADTGNPILQTKLKLREVLNLPWNSGVQPESEHE